MAGAGGGACLLLSAARLDFDKTLCLKRLRAAAGSGGLRAVYEAGARPGPHAREGDVAVVVKELEVTAEMVEALPRSVRLICEAGTGYNNIDLAAARARGISVANVPAYSTDAVATMCMTHILNFSSSMVQQQRRLWAADRGEWVRGVRGLPHFELRGRTLGLIGGRGTTGSRVTDLALPFGLRVLISSRTDAPSGRAGVEVVPMDELLRRSDFVSLHCPLNEHTRGLIGRPQLQMMKKGAYIVNGARGAIIDQAALCEALEAGEIAGAGLDVQEVEPPPPESPLFELAKSQKVLMTPHVGWQRLETRQRLLDAVADTVGAFLQGKPINIVASPGDA